MTGEPSEQVDRVGVAGAGLMGAEIALVFALAGHPVMLADVTGAALEAALQRLRATVDKGVARGLYTAEQAGLALERITATQRFDAFADRDIVVEAVFEQEDVKAETLRRLDAICGPACVFATNTSTIPITVLASHLGAERRARLIGTHYFSPASRMKLVEVIPGIETAPEVLEQVLALWRAVGKTPVLVKDVPGFAVSRRLSPMPHPETWLARTGISKGTVLRSLVDGRFGSALTDQSVSLIVKRRAKAAGYPADFAAHSLRPGFLTSAAAAGGEHLENAQGVAIQVGAGAGRLRRELGPAEESC